MEFYVRTGKFVPVSDVEKVDPSGLHYKISLTFNRGGEQPFGKDDYYFDVPPYIDERLERVRTFIDSRFRIVNSELRYVEPIPSDGVLLQTLFEEFFERGSERLTERLRRNLLHDFRNVDE